jgi:PAS domain S-box-containing protein
MLFGIITYEGRPADLISQIYITEKVGAEQKLKESEDKYRYFYDNAQVGLYWSRISDGKFIECNDTFAKLVGYNTREECLADYIAVEHYVNLKDRDEMLEKLKLNGNIKNYEIQVSKRDGTAYWANISARINLKENRIEGAATDITERKNIELKLEESEVRYKDLFENSPISLWEEDFSLVKNYIDNLKNSGIKDLRKFFKKNPKELKKCVSMVKIVNVNKKTLELYKVDNIESFFFMLSDIFTEESLVVFTEEIIAFAEGKTRFESEAITKTLKGDKFPILVVIEIIDGFQKDWSKVLISIIAITELKELEQNLKESEAKWRSITENSPDHILMMDKDAKILFINYTVPDLTVDEVIGKSYYDFVQEEFKEIQRKYLKEVMETGKPRRFETGFVDKDGNQFYFDVRSGPIWEEDKIIGIINHSSNITEQKKKEDEIRLHSEIMTNMSEGVYLIRLEDSIIVYANPRFEEMFGYEPGEIIGKNVVIVNAPTDKTPEETKNEIVGILKDTGEWHGEVLNIKKDGTPFWCYANVSLFDHHEYGRVTVSVHTDITERKEIEKEREKFFNLSLHMLLTAGFDGTILRTNPGWKEILGYDETDLLGNDFMDLVHPDDRKATIFEMEKLSKGLLTKHFENRYRHKDGSYRTLVWSAVPHLDKETVYAIAYDITEQKRVESEIIESERKLKDLIEAVPLGITISNPKGELFEANSYSIKMFGFDSKEEFLKTPAINLFNDPANRLQYLQLLNNGPVMEFETKFKQKNGKLFWGSVTSIAKTVGGDVIIFNTIQDISQRKINQEIIVDLAKLPAENPNPVLRVSKKFVLYINQAGTNLFQVKAGNRIPLALENYVRIVFNENKNLNSEIQLNSHIYSVFFVPIEGTGYANVYGMDITDRKKSGEKLRDSEEKYRILVETAEMGLVEFDIIGTKVSYINPKLLEILGYAKDELQSEKIFMDIVHPEDLENLIRVSKDMHLEFRIYKKDHKLRWLSGIRSNQYDKEGKILSARLWLEDTTERNELEELKSNLLTRFSHEFKTPLISITGFADLLLTEYEKQLDEKCFSYLKRIKEGSDRLKMLINSFVESSELDEDIMQVSLKQENLYDLISEALNELEGAIYMREHEINLNVDKNLITTFDKEKMYTVITNLLVNAINYTQKGGKISICSKIERKSIIISIKDTGIGLEESEIIRLFKPFGKIERYGKGWDIVIGGMGMGLYISKEIVELHDGKIWVESEGRDKGSTFYFSIPMIK